jgi:hypothetical protein
MLATRTLLFLALTGVSGATLAAGAADAPPPAVFVSKAAQDGMTEVELGKVALDNPRGAQLSRLHLRARRQPGGRGGRAQGRARGAGVRRHPDLARRLAGWASRACASARKLRTRAVR